MIEELLLDRPAPGVAVLTINRPERRNAITTPVVTALDQALADAAGDDSTAAIVLTGTGDRAFSAGYDIDELAAMDPAEQKALLGVRDDVLWRLFSSPVPVIAAVNGAAHGGGAMWATCCDIRVVSPASSFRFAAVKYGGAAMTWLLDTLVGGSWARDLLLSGRELSGAEAYRLGLATRYAEHPADLLETAVATAQQIAAHPAPAVRAHKQLALNTLGAALNERFAAERAVVGELLSGRSADQIFAPFLEGRSPLT